MRAFLAIIALLCCATSAADVPREAYRYKRTLTREARAMFGLDAPVPALAAQIHQESGWGAHRISRVGARGMSQFMPATERWANRTFPGLARYGGAMSPEWSIRALVAYDAWLLERVHGSSHFDRLWAALRSYNGGLGHWLAESNNALAKDRASIDAACGTARRHKSHCRENLGYPKRILIDLQPRYACWGKEVYP